MIAAGGCASTGPAATAPPSPPPAATAPSAPAATPALDNALDRARVDRALDAGLGRFMQRLLVEPYVERGRFRGWRVVRSPGGAIAHGDVVLRINGREVERPDQALAAWEEIRLRDEIVIDILREGQPLTVRVPIVPRP